MYLVIALALFVSAAFASAVEKGRRYNNMMSQIDATEIKRRIISRHRFDWSSNKCKPDSVVESYLRLTSAYLTLYVETPQLSRDWAVFNKRKSTFTNKALITWMSGFDASGFCKTGYFHRVPEKRHAAVKEVSDILGYDIRGVPQDQFWKVASDYEERFWFWTEIHAQINHPSIIDATHPGSSAYSRWMMMDIQNSPTISVCNALREKDKNEEECWNIISPFFNDSREKEIALAFINEDFEKLNSLSDEIGFDVSASGRTATIIAFAEKEGWVAHTYINPAINYPGYGYALFSCKLRAYNSWRALFGAGPIPEEGEHSVVEWWRNRISCYYARLLEIQELQNKTEGHETYVFLPHKES